MKTRIATIAVLMLLLMGVLFGFFGFKTGGTILMIIVVITLPVSYMILRHRQLGALPGTTPRTSPIAMFVLICLGAAAAWQHQVDKQAIEQLHAQTEKGYTKYEWYWKLPYGQYVHGRNENPLDERTGELVHKDENNLWVDVNYTENTHPEKNKIRLKKASEKTWEGSSEQNDPPEIRQLSLIEATPGVYSGKITWSDGHEGTCYLKVK